MDSISNQELDFDDLMALILVRFASGTGADVASNIRTSL